MKWDPRLDGWQNYKRWREDRKRRLKDGTTTCYAELSAREKARCLTLNEVLRAVERRIAPEVLTIGRDLDARVADPNDWVEDYEIDLEIALTLRADDPEIEVDGDNVFYVMFDLPQKRLPGYPEHDECELGGSCNHNFLPEAGQEGESHCYLYHDLTDHRGIDWHDIPRIGGMTVRLQVIYQQYVRLLSETV